MTNFDENNNYTYIYGLISFNIIESNEHIIKSLIDKNNLNMTILNFLEKIDGKFENNIYIIKNKTLINSINSCKKLDIINDFTNYIGYIRYYFEKFGNIQLNNNNIKITIKNNNKISEKLKIPSIISNDLIIYENINCIDFLGLIYNNCNNFCGNFYNEYLNIINCKYDKFYYPKIKVYKSDKNAILPSKNRNSDAGYDLTIIKESKVFNSLTKLYDTGIKLDIPNGYYVEVYPRSSLSKSGYMLANSVGIIDQGYRGNIYIALTKIDEKSPDLELPFKCCQMILKKQVYSDIEEVFKDLTLTDRNQGGYGSTNKIQ